MLPLGLGRLPRSRLALAAGAARAALPGPQAESSERPLRRRADRMLRPARVRMRRRKPWVLARRRLFGWKVRLLTMDLRNLSGPDGPMSDCGGGPVVGRNRKPAPGVDHGHAKTAVMAVTKVRERRAQGQTSADPPSAGPPIPAAKRPRGSDTPIAWPESPEWPRFSASQVAPSSSQLLASLSRPRHIPSPTGCG